MGLEAFAAVAVYDRFTFLAHHTTMILWKERLTASGIHLGISASIAVLAAFLVFALWYPYPYREISGGRELFLLVVTVDVFMGPLITLAIFDRAKPRTELRRDLTVVALLQLGALGYGLWTVAVARPVHLVFEIDRFRVVHAIDIPEALLPLVPPQIEAKPWTGPTPLAVRTFRSENERTEATIAALGGVQLGARPDLWEPYAAARSRVLATAKPVSQLKRRFPDRGAQIDSALRSGRRDEAHALWLPLVGRKNFWTAFIDPATAEVVAFLPLDSF